MSNVSFKKFVSFVNLDGDVSDEQINEIFGLFKNNDKVEKLKKEREKLKGMSAQKKAELDKALQDFKDGKKTPAKGALSHDVWDDALSGDDRSALARNDKAVARDEKSKDDKNSGPKNKTGRNFYEAKEATVKAIKIKIHSTTTDEYIQRFIDDQTEVTVEDWERKGDTLYLYPYFDIEISEPRLIGMQQRLQREF